VATVLTRYVTHAPGHGVVGKRRENLDSAAGVARPAERMSELRLLPGLLQET